MDSNIALISQNAACVQYHAKVQDKGYSSINTWVWGASLLEKWFHVGEER